MKPRKHVRLPADLLRNRLVRKSKTGLIIHWILLRLAECHGYIPLTDDGGIDPFDAETIADDLGYEVGRLAGREGIIQHIEQAISRAKQYGLLVESQKTVNTGGRHGGSTKVITGWTSPLHQASRPRAPKKVSKGKQRYSGKALSSDRNHSEIQAPRARGLIHTQNTKIKSDPPGREQW